MENMKVLILNKKACANKFSNGDVVALYPKGSCIGADNGLCRGFYADLSDFGEFYEYTELSKTLIIDLVNQIQETVIVEGEEFKVTDYFGKYYFSNDKLYQCGARIALHRLLASILYNEVKIEQIPKTHTISLNGDLTTVNVDTYEKIKSIINGQ